MKSKIITKNTNNNKIYNRYRKKYLCNKGIIKCNFCGYHKGENSNNNFYAIITNKNNTKKSSKFPNWKLVSKNRKQWMKKNLFFNEEENNFYKFLIIKF